MGSPLSAALDQLNLSTLDSHCRFSHLYTITRVLKEDVNSASKCKIY